MFFCFFFAFEKSRIRSSILDILNLRCLLGHSPADVKGQLEIYESGVRERGLGDISLGTVTIWMVFNCRRLDEIIRGLCLCIEESSDD